MPNDDVKQTLGDGGQAPADCRCVTGCVLTSHLKPEQWVSAGLDPGWSEARKDHRMKPRFNPKMGPRDCLADTDLL